MSYEAVAQSALEGLDADAFVQAADVQLLPLTDYIQEDAVQVSFERAARTEAETELDPELVMTVPVDDEAVEASQHDTEITHVMPELNIMQNSQAITPTSTAAAAEQAVPVSQQDVIDQIVDNMRFEVRGNTQEIRISLRPEHLGDLTMRIATQNGIVTAQFIAESQRVKEIIESGFNQLRDSLAAQGIDIAEINVSVSDSESGGEQASFGSDISDGRIDDLIERYIEEEQAVEVDEDGILRSSMVDIRA